MLLNGYQDFELVVFFTRYTFFLVHYLCSLMNSVILFLYMEHLSKFIREHSTNLAFAMYFYKATTMNMKQLCDTVNHDTSPIISICAAGKM